jgi:hypothetical protein
MTPVSRFVIAVAMACLPLLAGAEGKCNDDPFLLPDGKTLAVTWTIPVPAGATANTDPGTFMKQLDADNSFPIEPAGFPIEYATNVWPASYPSHPQTKKKILNGTAHAAWLRSFGLAHDPAAVPITANYFANNRHVLFGMVVQHPPVPNAGRAFKFCTCILQRAVLIWDANKENLWVRTRFRSAKDNLNWANFEPADPVKFRFDSPSIWFPLAYNDALPEPPAFLVLDVVTRKPLAKAAVPPGFAVEDPRPVTYNNETWSLTRLRRRYDKSEPSADLSIAPPQ